MRTPGRSFFLCLVVSAWAVSSDAEEPKGTPARPPSPRVYTNEDLERLSPRRGETGVRSEPAASAAANSGARAAAGQRGRPAATLEADRARRDVAERFWRRQAEALRRRLLPLRQRLDELRASLEQSRETAARARRRPHRLGASETAEQRARSLERRVAALQDRIDSEQALLAERARRAGALPGWLR